MFSPFTTRDAGSESQIPRIMTACKLRRFDTVSSGFRFKRIRSALMPGAIFPVRSAQLIARAALVVADRSASSGVSPRSSIISSSSIKASPGTISS